MNCLFMYNPASGKGKITRFVGYIKEKLSQAYDVVDVFESCCPKEMQYKAKDTGENYDAIVFAGGDGSFNEVLQGIAELEKKPTLGYIPTGTVNDIARATGIPRRIKCAVKNILNGTAADFDVIKVNDSYAMYCVCAGAFTSSSYLARQSSKKMLGKLAYGLEGMRRMKFEHFKLNYKADGVCYSTQSVFVLIMNGKSVAGLPVNNGGKMDDGILEAIIVTPQQTKRGFKKLASLLSVLKVFVYGYIRIKEKNIQRLKGCEFEFETDVKVVWNFDGERGSCGSIKVSALNRHIKLIVPQK